MNKYIALLIPTVAIAAGLIIVTPGDARAVDPMEFFWSCDSRANCDFTVIVKEQAGGPTLSET
ncbi:MAG: hypothetical protein MJE77_48190 [Proteobacteria bacterium]|nr:hypothetical protein [Pseudomonadota bacterium]